MRASENTLQGETLPPHIRAHVDYTLKGETLTRLRHSLNNCVHHDFEPKFSETLERLNAKSELES